MREQRQRRDEEDVEQDGAPQVAAIKRELKAIADDPERGERLVEVLKQGQYVPWPVEEQVVAIFAGTHGYLDPLPPESIGRYQSELISYLKSERASILSDIISKGKIDDTLESQIEDALKAFANVCRHRGSLVCLEPEGSTRKFTCPYHGWTYDLEGNFNNLSSGNFTYLLMPAGTRKTDLQPQLDGVFDRHFPEESRAVVAGIKVRKLVEAHNVLWDAVGLPILETVRVLGVLVLLVAIVNYTNLATAQSLGRSREIGLRKTMGASRRQLILQFLVESLVIAAIAMVIAIAALEIIIPLLNNAANKALTIDYLRTLPWLLAMLQAAINWKGL